MVPYIITFFVSCLFFNLASKNSRKWSVSALVAILFPSFLAGFRNISVGTDTVTYYEMTRIINHFSGGIIDYLSINLEIFYYLISRMSLYLGGMWFVFFSYQLITIVCIYNVAWRFKSYSPLWLVFWLYFCLLFPYSLNILRQIAAVAYVLNISLFLIDGKPKRFGIAAVFCIGFHASAIIACGFIWIIYWLCQQKPRERKILTPVFFCILATGYFLFQKITPLLSMIGLTNFDRYDSAYAAVSSSYLSITDVTFRFAIAFILMIASSYKVIDSKISYPYFLIIITELMLLGLGLYNEFLFRMAVYFTVFHLLLLPTIANSNKLAKTTRRFTCSMVFFMGLIYWLWVFVHNGTNEIIPYTSI